MRLEWGLAVVFALACGPGGGNGSAGDGNDDGGDDGGTATSGGDGASSGMSAGPGGSMGPGGTSNDTTDDASDSTGLPADVETWELRAGGFTPPGGETWYSCFAFTFEVDQLHHIVGFVPQVTSPLIHHYVLSLAAGEVNTNPSDPCFEWPAQILWAWAPGIQSFTLPDEAGFLFGTSPTGRQSFVLQVHYNDPLGQGIVDNDGIDVLVTKALRPNRAGMLSQGDIFSIFIPPGNPAYEHVATCGSALTGQLLPEPINVFASFLHAHEIGIAMRTDVYRNDALLGTLAAEDPWDFNSQKFLDADMVLEAGDRIQTHCTYDSSERAGVTMGGVASSEEMCINFMMYYPWVPSETCGAL